MGHTHPALKHQRDTEGMIEIPDQTLRYAAREPEAFERQHPLTESGWKAVGHSTLEGQTDAVLLERHGHHRLIELFDDYAWVQDKRGLDWQEFIQLETEPGDRAGWIQSIFEKLGAFGHAIPQPKVWVARNDEYGADWLLGLEF